MTSKYKYIQYNGEGTFDYRTNSDWEGLSMAIQHSNNLYLI